MPDDTLPAESTARRMWRLFEPVHAVTYFAPACAAAFERTGLRGFWRGYFAGRAAPLGPVGAAPVAGSFFGFAPPMVRRALPDVWTKITPAMALAARLDGAREALAPAEAELGPNQLAELADLLRTAAGAAPLAGRVLAAANAALPWPGDPLGIIWQATTILREHRGDGHAAALVTAGLDGAESCVWRSGLDGVGREEFQRVRGWSDDEWTSAAGRLRTRGWLDATGAPTPTAERALRDIEATTDRLAAAPWDSLNPAALDRCATLLTPLAQHAATCLRWPNPIGVPDPRQPPG
ncbi:hypothetical protein [Frankia sp. AgB32]|uniref:SCO6745 family protein n=1 Tax=Frankia sp. AgB32 TaxID=631119 RepID=UPI00200DBA5A|nr:hypothetical protein [Frankia sp. AgB32]MCK9896068.1 hypothetical protein [Frankia sp. AgB32]